MRFYINMLFHFLLFVHCEPFYRNVPMVYYQISYLKNSIPTLKSQEKIAEEIKSLAEHKFNLGQTGKNPFFEASIDQNEINASENYALFNFMVSNINANYLSSNLVKILN